MASISIDSHNFRRLPIAMAEVAGPSPVPIAGIAETCAVTNPDAANPFPASLPQKKIGRM